MGLVLTKQEFAWLQCFLNDLYQDYQVRSGPSGPTVESIRTKVLATNLDFTDSERRFLLYNINDVFQCSQSPVVKPQISLQVSYVGDRDTKGELRQVISQIQQLTNTSGNAELAPQYLLTWEVMQNIMTKLGLVAPSAPPPPSKGASVDRQAENLGRQPNINPDDRMGFTKDGERTL